MRSDIGVEVADAGDGLIATSDAGPEGSCGMTTVDELREWARQYTPWPCAEVQIYRAREGDKRGKCTEFLETMLLREDWVTLERLEHGDRDDLESMIPFEETRVRWGGGDYQFRFRWRDRDGNVVKRRSQNASIWGRPIPKR